MKLLSTTVTAAVAVLFVSLAAGAAPARWRETSAPVGGPVVSLALAPGGATLYAGTLAGVFASRDGVTWQRGGLRGVREATVWDIEAVSTTSAYALGTAPNAGALVLRTSDAGATWQRATAGFEDGEHLYDLAAVPGSPSVAYASGFGGVYKTSDGGNRWHLTRGPVLAFAIAVDPAAPETVYAGASEDGAMSVSFDGGAHWADASGGFPRDVEVTALAVRATTPRTLYAGTLAHGVFKTVDGGATWRAAPSGLRQSGDRYLPIGDVVLDPAVPDLVYVGTPVGVATSSDGGTTWQAQSGDDSPSIADLVVDPTAPGTLVAAALGEGVLRSTDRGEHWQSLGSSGLNAVVPLAVAVDPKAPSLVYVGTLGSGLVATRNGGRTWSPAMRSPGSAIAAVVVDPKAHRTLYVATSDRAVLKSSDAGATWTAAGDGLRLGSVSALALDPRHPSTLYAAQGSVFKSVDAGASWRPAGPKLDDADVRALAVDPSRPSTVYAANGFGGTGRARGVYVSTNAGKTWRRLTAGLGDRQAIADLNALAVVPRTHEVFATSDQGVFHLRPGAKRWADASTGLPPDADGLVLGSVGAIAIHPRTGAVFVGTPRGLYTLVRGKGSLRWRLAERALAERSVGALAFSARGSRLYAATPGRFFVSGRRER